MHEIELRGPGIEVQVGRSLIRLTKDNSVTSIRPESITLLRHSLSEDVNNPQKSYLEIFTSRIMISIWDTSFNINNLYQKFLKVW